MNPDLQRRIQRYGWDYASSVYDRSWQSRLEPAFDGGAVAMAWRRIDEEEKKSANTEYLESIVGFRTDEGGYAIPGEFVVVSGRRSAAVDTVP